MTTDRQPTAIRLKPDTFALLELLKKDMGLSRTGVIELAVRDLAKQRGIALPKDAGEDSRA